MRSLKHRVGAPRTAVEHRPAARSRLPAILCAAALLVSSSVHADLADRPWYADGQVTLHGLFLGQAVAALVCAVWLLALRSKTACLAGAAVGLASLLALLVTVYVQVPSVGPLPAVYEPFWYAEKVVAVLAAGVAVVAASAALAPARVGR